MATYIDAGVQARTTWPDTTGVRGRAGDVEPARRRVARPNGKRTRSARAERLPGRGLRRPAWSRAPIALCAQTRNLGEWGWLASAAAFSFLVVVLVGLFGLDGGGAAVVPGGAAVVQVQDGDTLWELARRFAPESDPRAVVQRIVEVNGLDRAAAEAGRTLVVPTGRS